MSNLPSDISLGPCCACGSEEGVRHLLLLDQRSPIAGRGWGCFSCALPMDGAVAVVCELCSARNAPLRWACRGYPGTDGRVPVGELAGRHEHDQLRCSGLLAGKKPADSEWALIN